MHMGRCEWVHVQAYVCEHTFGDQKLNLGITPPVALIFLKISMNYYYYYY